MRSKLNVAGIYTITSPSGGVYVGSAVLIRRRWHQHKIELRAGRHGNAKLLNAWRKYGEEFMCFELLLVCRPADLLMFEQRAMETLKPRYNISPIAGNNIGVKWSPEARARNSERKIGKKLSDSTRANMALARLGKRHSDTTKAKIRASGGWKHADEAKAKMKGRQFSEAHLENLRKSHLGNKNRLGAIISAEMRTAISAKLKGRKRSSEAVAKQRATLAARHA